MQDDIEKAWESHDIETVTEKFDLSGLTDCQSDNLVAIGYLLFTAGYRAHAARSGWVDIEDARQVKDDGEHVDLLLFYGDKIPLGRRTNCYWGEYKSKMKWISVLTNQPITATPIYFRRINIPPPPQLKGGE